MRLVTLALLAATALPAAEVTGTFLGWSGGNDTASYLFEVEHVTKRFMRIRDRTKMFPGVRLLRGARLRVTVTPVGPKDQFADGMDGLLDAIQPAGPPSDFVQAVDRAMREVLQSMEDGNCASAVRRIVGSRQVEQDWHGLCDVLRHKPFLVARGDTWALISVELRQCRVILDPGPFQNPREFSLMFELTDGALRLTEVQSLAAGTHLRLFYGE